VSGRPDQKPRASIPDINDKYHVSIPYINKRDLQDEVAQNITDFKDRYQNLMISMKQFLDYDTPQYNIEESYQ
jgi:hypothetical protein